MKFYQLGVAAAVMAASLTVQAGVISSGSYSGAQIGGVGLGCSDG